MSRGEQKRNGKKDAFKKIIKENYACRRKDLGFFSLGTVNTVNRHGNLTFQWGILLKCVGNSKK